MNTRIYESFESLTSLGAYWWYGNLYWVVSTGTGNPSTTLSSSNVTEGSYNWLVVSDTTSVYVDCPYQDLTNIDNTTLNVYNNKKSTSFYLRIAESNGSGRTVQASLTNRSIGNVSISLSKQTILAQYSDFDFSNCLIRLYVTNTNKPSFHLNSLSLSTDQEYPIIVTIYETGSMATGTTSSTVKYHTAKPGDLLLLAVETANYSVTTPSGWTEASISPQSIGTAGSSTATRLSLYYKICGEADTSVTVSATGADHLTCVLLNVWNYDIYNPIVNAYGSTASSSTSVSFPTTSTLRDNSLVFNVGTNATDTDTTQASSLANSDLTNISGTSYNTSTGNGGGITWMFGEKSTAGAVSASTCTLSTASQQALATFVVGPYIAPITGSFETTTDSVSISSSCKILVSGNTNKSLENLTIVSQGSFGSTLEATLQDLTLSSTGTISIEGYTNSTLDNISVSLDGNLPISGDTNIVLDGISTNSNSAHGSILNKTLSNVQLSSSGKLNIQSNLSKQLDNLTINSNSNLQLEGSLNSSLDSVGIVSEVVPYCFRYATSTNVLEDCVCSSSDTIEISFNDYFTPPSGYSLLNIRLISTSPEVIQYSQDYAALYDTDTTALGEYGKVSSFKIKYTVLATYVNDLDSSVTTSEKKVFKTEILPNWSYIRDATLENYFKDTTISGRSIVDFITEMKSKGYYA